MSAGKPPGEDDVKKSETSEINQKKKSATAAKCLGTLNAVEVERVQVSSEVITGTPSTLADLPSTEMQSLLRPQNSKQLTAIMEDDEAFRWRGTAFEKAAATSSPQAETTTDDKAALLTPSVLKDLPSTSTVVSLHLEQPELKPMEASEAFLFAKNRPVSAKKTPKMVKSKPERPPQPPLKRTSPPARQIVCKKSVPKKPHNSPKPQVAEGKAKVKAQTGKQTATNQQPLTTPAVQGSPLPPFSTFGKVVQSSQPISKHNLFKKETRKTPGQKKKTARQQAAKKASPNIAPQKDKGPFQRKEFPQRPPPTSPKTSGLKSAPGKAVRVAPVATAASPGNKAAKKTKQTQMATQVNVEKAKTTATSKQTPKQAKLNNGLLFTSYIFRPPPKE
ncbi:hypothetical protein TYRP_019386 [Tyrophagus putrescentiae]|nr:hypothetical protein TYRP_019386 [Tyrophagus putrescentiae]